MEIINPTNARKNLYDLINKVVANSQPVEIASTKDEKNSVVVVSKSDWDAIQETMYLQNVGVLDRIEHFKGEEADELGEIDWNTL